MTDNLHWIESAYKICLRGGDFIKEVFQKESKHLEAKDCMKLKDYYGIRSQDVIKLAISHDFTVDNAGFAKLLDQDDLRQKSRKQCKNEKQESESSSN